MGFRLPSYVYHMKVAVFAWLNHLDTRYSVAGVCLDQIHLLARKLGPENVSLITRSTFDPEGTSSRLPQGVEVLTLPDFDIDTPFDGLAVENLNQLYVWSEKHSLPLALILKEFDWVFTHDLVFNPQFIAPFLAMANAIERLEKQVRFLHWTHSVPRESSERASEGVYTRLRQALPNSTYVSLTYEGVEVISDWYGVAPSEVVVIPNFVDVCDRANLSRELADKISPYLRKLVLFYPSRFDPGKQPLWAVQLLRGFLDNNVDASLIMSLCYMQGTKRKNEMREFRNTELVASLLQDNRICILDQEHDGLGLNREEIRGLYQISDLLIHPSTTESFGLTVLEGCTEGCIPVINWDVPAFREFLGGKISGLQYQNGYGVECGSTERSVQYNPNSRIWFQNTASQIMDSLRLNPLYNSRAKVRTKLSADVVWERYIKPVLSRR